MITAVDVHSGRYIFYILNNTIYEQGPQSRKYPHCPPIL